MDDTASTASATNDAGATIPENQNELTTEISEQDEAALVDRVLGVDGPPKVKTSFDPNARPAPKAAETEEEAEDEEKSEDEQTEEEKAAAEAKVKEEADKKAEEDRKAEEERKAAESEEEEAAADIAAVDTSDLWVEVDAIRLGKDAEGNETRTKETVRLTVDTGLEGMPDDVYLENDKQMMEVLDAVNEMRRIRADRQAEYDQKVAEKQEADNKAASEQATFAGWDAEIATLIEAGELEQPKVQPDDPKFMEDPAAQKIDEVFKFMTTENEKRNKEGKAPIRTFTLALNLLNKEQNKAGEKEAAKKKDAEIKAKGAMVGGGSSASAGSKGEFVYKSGSAKSIWGVPTDDI